MELTTAIARGMVLRSRQEGQSLPEFLIVVPVFLFLVLLVFQMMLIYRAKNTLDYAALEAARAGAVNNAEMEAMRDGLAKGLTPLYATDTGTGGLLEAWARAKLDVNGVGGVGGQARIEIVSPTRQAWDDFREKHHSRNKRRDGTMALPNDSLAFRPATIGSSGLNVQDANVLKIRVRYNYPLIVPFVDLVLRGNSEFVPSSGMFDPTRVNMTKRPYENYYRIPIESTAIVRMQSPIYSRSNLPNR